MYMQTSYSNLERIESIDDFAEERLLHVLDKFDDGHITTLKARFEMEHSPDHAGKDAFAVDVKIFSSRYPVVRIRKEAPNLYDAINEAAEKLNNVYSRLHKKRLSRLHGRQHRVAGGRAA